MLNPMAATEMPSTTARGKTAHQLVATNSSRRYDEINHARMVAVLKYICGQSRRRRPVRSKYASTRRRSSRTKRSLRLNFRWRQLSEPANVEVGRAVSFIDWDDSVMVAPVCLARHSPR